MNRVIVQIIRQQPEQHYVLKKQLVVYVQNFLYSHFMNKD